MPELEHLPWWLVVFANVSVARFVFAYTGILACVSSLKSASADRRKWKIEIPNPKSFTHSTLDDEARSPNHCPEFSNSASEIAYLQPQKFHD